MIRQHFEFGAICASCLLAGATHAAVEGYLLGTDAPPASLGGVTFTPFAPDMHPLFAQVQTVALDGSNPPTGVTIGFNEPLQHQRIGQGWATWSHGYMGDVYIHFDPTPTNLVMPPETLGFYLYVEPGPFQDLEFTVSAQTTGGASTSLKDTISGRAGAKGFALVVDAGESLSSITVLGPARQISRAIGEFGIAMIAEEPADFDGDGDVDGFDLALLLGAWGACEGGVAPITAPQKTVAPNWGRVGTAAQHEVDLDGDGVIDGRDMSLILAAWSGEKPASVDSNTANVNGDGWVNQADLNMLLGK